MQPLSLSDLSIVSRTSWGRPITYSFYTGDPLYWTEAYVDTFFGAGVTGPLSDNVAFKLEGIWVKRDGFYDDVIYGLYGTDTTYALAEAVTADDVIELEAERLLASLMNVECDPRGRTWNLDTCREIAPLTLEINRLKKEKGAVILAHSYVSPVATGVVAGLGTGGTLTGVGRYLKEKLPGVKVVPIDLATVGIVDELDVRRSDFDFTLQPGRTRFT